jgi:hypothetical protein
MIYVLQLLKYVPGVLGLVTRGYVLRWIFILQTGDVSQEQT